VTLLRPPAFVREVVVEVADVQQNGRRASSPPKLRLVPAEAPAVAESEPDGTRRLLAAVAAVEAWEGEGGYIPSIGRKPKGEDDG
jgi:hypothetical protein